MPDVTITLRTIDNSSPAVKKVKDQFQSLTPGIDRAAKGIAGFVSANATLIGAVVGVGAALGKSYNDFQKYAGSVRDLAIASGTGAKEASTLLQVLDDFEISASDVTAATKAMKEKGLVPTIDTLAKLSDQFLAIEDPAERLKFAQDNLGRSSAAFLNVLNQGSQALKENATQVNKNLILTDEQIKKAEQARLAVDAWADAWEGFEISIGSAVGEMIAANAAAEGAQRTYEDLNGIVQTGRGSATTYADAVNRLAKSTEKGALATEFYSKMQSGLNSVLIDESIPTVEAMTEKNQGLLGVIDQLQSEMDSYTEKNNDLLMKLQELQAAQDMVPEWSDKYKDYGEQIEETKSAIGDLAEEHEEAGKRIAFSLVSQKAAMDGLTDAEFTSLLILGEQWGIYDKTVVESAIAMDEQAGKIADALDEPRNKLFDMNAKVMTLKRLGEEGISITVGVHYVTTGKPPPSQANPVIVGNCFTGDTLIMMGDGTSRAIKDIQPGDEVTSYDLTKGTILLTRVVEVFKHERQPTQSLLLLNGYLKVTPEHLLWDGIQWKPAGAFQVGDLLMNADGGMMNVKSIRLLYSDETVYNLHVDHVAHNYFAGGVLVHNDKAHGFAAGGKLGDKLALVGDMPGGQLTQWSELITPDGTVIDAKTTSKLFALGIVGNDVSSFASPGDSFGVNTLGSAGGRTPRRPGGGRAGGGTSRRPRRGRRGGGGAESGGGGGGGGGGGNSDTGGGGDDIPTGGIGDTPPTDTAAVATAVTTLQQQLQQQQQATIKSNQEVVKAVEALAGIMTTENPRAIGKQVGYELSKAS